MSLVLYSSGLKGGGGGGGASDGQGSTFTYTFHGDPHATFATFFGGTNPFEMFFGRKVTALIKCVTIINNTHSGDESKKIFTLRKCSDL